MITDENPVDCQKFDVKLFTYLGILTRKKLLLLNFFHFYCIILRQLQNFEILLVDF